MIKKSSSYYLAGSVALVTALGYLPALKNGFVSIWDDNEYILENPFIRNINAAFFKWAFLNFHASNWHPLTWISHAVDYAVWGFDPRGHHLTNVILHAINTLLVVLLAVRLATAAGGESRGSDQPEGVRTRALIIGGVAGFLFGLHPLHVESVAWVAERKDLLCALFFLLSSMAYTKYVTLRAASPAGDKGPRHFDRHYFIAFGFFLLALLSKPMALTLPVVFLILDWYPFRRIGSMKDLGRALVEKIPLMGLSLASALVTMAAQHSGEAVWDAMPLLVRILVAAQALAGYLGKMILPLNLLPFYPYPLKLPLMQSIGASAFVIGCSAACLIASRKQKIWMAVWLYYLVTLSPVLGIVQVGGQAMADRYTYLPGLGPFLLAGAGTAWAAARIDTLARFKRQAAAAGAILALVLIAGIFFGTVKQIAIWKDDLSLWDYTVTKEPDKSLLAYYNRGAAYAKQGLYHKAIEDYNRVIQWNYKEYSNVYISRGVAFWKTGQMEPAIADFRKACELGAEYGCQAMQYVIRNRPQK